MSRLSFGISHLALNAFLNHDGEMLNPHIHSDNRLSRLGGSGKQAVLGKEFDHKAVKQPGLLYLAGVAGSGQSF